MSSDYDYQHPCHISARKEAFARSEECCQFCGLREATEAHHWRGYAGGTYKSEVETTADELIALCKKCHNLATEIRQEYRDAYRYAHQTRQGDIPWDEVYQ